MKPKNTLHTYELEFDDVYRNFTEHHDYMATYKDYYKNNVFYKTKSNKKAYDKVGVNLLKAFADKNIHYTSRFPTIKVPAGTDYEGRRMADLKEKILHATHWQNNTYADQAKFAYDATIMADAINVLEFDIDARCVKRRRIDPRHCVWQYADDNANRLLAVWVFYPMTVDAVKKRWGKSVESGSVELQAVRDREIMDGKDYVLYVERYDENTQAKWVGNTWLEKPHKHKFDAIPVDICMPFFAGDVQNKGDFFLADLVVPQAEINETLRRKASIVRKLGNPAIWARNVVRSQFQDVKKTLAGEGGFIGLKGDGELGILQLKDTDMLDSHIRFNIDQMMRISGFGQASFGESVGANTSGDALGMYFTPTTRAIAHQQLQWRVFYESINWKILNAYRNYLKTGERIKLQGYRPKTSYMGATTKIGQGRKTQYSESTFVVEFGKEELKDGNFYNKVEFESPTPKDEIAYKRLLFEASQTGLISKNYALEEWGVESPQDVLEELRNEQSDPELNPEGVASLLDAEANLQQQEGLANEQSQAQSISGGQAYTPENQA